MSSAFVGLPKRQPLHPQMGGKPPEKDDIEDFISDEESPPDQIRADLAKKRKRISVEFKEEKLKETALHGVLNGLKAATQSATNALNVVIVKRRALNAELTIVNENIKAARTKR